MVRENSASPTSAERVEEEETLQRVRGLRLSPNLCGLVPQVSAKNLGLAEFGIQMSYARVLLVLTYVILPRFRNTNIICKGRYLQAELPWHRW